jgi:hypothetical protein
MANRKLTFQAWTSLANREDMEPVLMVALDQRGRGAMVPSIGLAARLKEVKGPNPKTWWSDDIAAAMDTLLRFLTQQVKEDTHVGDA